MSFNFQNSYLELPDILYQKTNPTPVSDPKLIVFNQKLADSLGLNLKNDDYVMFLSGNKLPANAAGIAQAYSGHQYGYYTNLGDGRALLLGEHISPDFNRFDIQLKGSGPTRYSRRGDGRAALSPMLREYLISEAMYFLNIPTTRSLAVTLTGEEVYRENVSPGAVLTRVAKSHIRVGTFQFIAAHNDLDLLKTFSDYTIKRHFPNSELEKDKYLSFFKSVCKNQSYLIGKWMLVGFIHGVMNTDNMSISGETIDYGPCAFMDEYNVNTVFSSIDKHGRYAYSQQIPIAAWNLARLAECLLPLFSNKKEEALTLAEEVLKKFVEETNDFFLNGLLKKIGIFNVANKDQLILQELLRLMEKYKADFTVTFRDLANPLSSEQNLFKQSEFHNWHQKWLKRIQSQNINIDQIYLNMNQINPSVIPRNHIVDKALRNADLGDYKLFHEFLDVLAKPFAGNHKKLFTTPPLSTEKIHKTFCGT